MFESKSLRAGFAMKPLVFAMTCAITNFAMAEPEQAPAETSTLPTVNVTGKTETNNVLQSSSGVARIEGPVQDIPQAVNVVPSEILQQQQVTTLEQALRNVPGITVAIGEANGGANGDQFRIRGMATKNDTYLDGLRDFGVYVRDTFNTERVEVLKGPSSENFGIGTNGGTINSQSKRAHLENASSVDLMVGTGAMNRQAVDINRQINDTTAIRLNAMRQDQDFVDRDFVESDRWGVAFSLGLGLGTDTTWFLNYMHQSNDRTPDFGQPMIGRTASSVRHPVSEYGIDRANYYGKDTDRDRSDADILTSIFRTALSGDTTLSNETRIGYYEREFSTTTTTCDQTCANAFFKTGDGVYTFGAGGGPHYFQRSYGIQNITTLATAFETGSWKHDARIGLDLAHQKDHRVGYAWMRPDMSGTASKITGSLQNPNWSSDNYIDTYNPNSTNNQRESKLTDIAIFASDRVHFTPEWSVLGSVRWDSYKQNSELSTRRTGAVAGDVDTKSTFVSPKLSLLWEPSDMQTYYLSYGWASTAPWAGSISADANPLGVNNTAAGGNNLRKLDPEKTRTLELGGKISLLDSKLGLTASIFRTEKENTYYDNGTGGLSASGNEERYKGIELGMSGQFTQQWAIYAGYTYLDSEITDSNTKANIGNPVQGAARHSANLWTTYDLTPLLASYIPGRLMVGGGATYRDSMYTRDDKMAELPYSLSYDAMVSYDYRNFRLALNGYNLDNRINYDNFFAGENANTARAIPSAGRTVILSARILF